jgi:hypothetical protein
MNRASIVTSRYALVIVTIAASVGRAYAEPLRQAFVDADLGFGFATVDTSQGLCGSSPSPKGMLPMARGGVGAGWFVGENLALVVRAHGSDATSAVARSVAFFVGGGILIRAAQLSTERDYVYFEVVPGYEISGTSEIGNNATLGSRHASESTGRCGLSPSLGLCRSIPLRVRTRRATSRSSQEFVWAGFPDESRVCRAHDLRQGRPRLDSSHPVPVPWTLTT